MALNSTQKNIIEETLKFPLDNIKEFTFGDKVTFENGIDDDKALIALQLILADKVTLEQQRELESEEWNSVWYDVEGVRDILTSKCPQEKLNLSAYNDDPAIAVTKGDVVEYIKKEVSIRINTIIIGKQPNTFEELFAELDLIVVEKEIEEQSDMFKRLFYGLKINPKLLLSKTNNDKGAENTIYSYLFEEPSKLSPNAQVYVSQLLKSTISYEIESLKKQMKLEKIAEILTIFPHHITGVKEEEFSSSIKGLIKKQVKSLLKSQPVRIKEVAEILEKFSIERTGLEVKGEEFNSLIKDRIESLVNHDPVRIKEVAEILEKFSIEQTGLEVKGEEFNSLIKDRIESLVNHDPVRIKEVNEILEAFPSEKIGLDDRMFSLFIRRSVDCYIKNDNLAEVEGLLEKYPDRATNILFSAVENGNMKAVNLAIDRDGKEQIKYQENTPLKNGKEESHGRAGGYTKTSRVSTINHIQTVFSKAIDLKNVQILKFLIEKFPSEVSKLDFEFAHTTVSAVSDRRSTYETNLTPDLGCLTYATLHSNLEALEALLKNKSIVEAAAKNGDCWKAMHISDTAHNDAGEMIKKYVKIYNIKLDSSSVPPTGVKDFQIKNAVKSDDIKELKYLVAIRKDLRTIEYREYETSVLGEAVNNRNFEIAKFLVQDCGLDPYETDNTGISPVDRLKKVDLNSPKNKEFKTGFKTLVMEKEVDKVIAKMLRGKVRENGSLSASKSNEIKEKISNKENPFGEVYSKIGPILCNSTRLDDYLDEKDFFKRSQKLTDLCNDVGNHVNVKIDAKGNNFCIKIDTKKKLENELLPPGVKLNSKSDEKKSWKERVSSSLGRKK